MSAESPESLAHKCREAAQALEGLVDLRRRALPRGVGLIHGACAALPLGLIPISLTWTAAVFFLPDSQPLILIRLYALGLLGILLAWAAVRQTQTLVNAWKLADGVLGRIARMRGLAYHPNAALRRELAARGHVTLGDFKIWYERQHQILETRLHDYQAARDLAREQSEGSPAIDTAGFPPGARAFLEG